MTTEKEPNLKLLEVMRDEAITCMQRGDHEDCRQLLFSILDRLDMSTMSKEMIDETLVPQLMREYNSPDIFTSTKAMLLLSYFIY